MDSRKIVIGEKEIEFRQCREVKHDTTLGIFTNQWIARPIIDGGEVEFDVDATKEKTDKMVEINWNRVTDFVTNFLDCRHEISLKANRALALLVKEMGWFGKQYPEIGSFELLSVIPKDVCSTVNSFGMQSHKFDLYFLLLGKENQYLDDRGGWYTSFTGTRLTGMWRIQE